MLIKQERLSEGSYGLVYQIKDTNLALKRNLAENDTTFMSSIRELNILYLLRSHPNIVRIEEVVFGDIDKDFSPLAGEDRLTQRDDGVHFVFKKADFDLHDYIQENKDGFKKMKKYMADILLGCHYMHQQNIIHRDLKPCNILLFDNTAKICDFGFSKPYTRQGAMTPGICTAPYRAPEIILSTPDYNFKSDVWSMGCLFYEMISKQAFVNEVSDDDKKLMTDILSVLPNPLSSIQFKEWVTNNPHRTFSIRNTKSTKKRKTFYQQMGLSASGIKNFFIQTGSKLDVFCDLLNNMMKFHPSQRFSVKACLEHAFFNSLREYIDDTIDTYKTNMKDEVLLYIPCQEREWMAKIVQCLFKNKDQLEWYNHRCLFQAVDMFQRYLYVMYYNKKTIPFDSRVHDEFTTNLLFMACIYMSIKYFSTIHYPIPFSSIVEDVFLTPECQKLVQEFEGGLIKNCFQYNVYHETLYEAADADILDDQDIACLLILMTMNPHVCGLTNKVVYAGYKNNLKHQEEKIVIAFNQF